MIKRDSLKYQWYGTDIPEVLFNLDRDPNENENVNVPNSFSQLERSQTRTDDTNVQKMATRC